MAEKKKIMKRVISKAAPTSTPAPVVEQVEVETASEIEVKAKRSCYFCKSKSDPTYTDLVNLKKYLTERAKIVPKLRSSLCAKHQRAVSRQIKYARHLSLLPFVPKV